MNLIKKIYLKNNIVITLFNIEKVTNLYKEVQNNNYLYKSCDIDDIDDIVDFYRNNNYNLFVTSKEVLEQFKMGNKFYAIFDLDRIVAGLWVHEGIVDIAAPSFEAFKLKHKHIVLFSDGVLYGSHGLVDFSYRGRGLFSSLFLSTLWDYKDKNKNSYIHINGFDNKKMISLNMEYMGQIIGLVRVVRIFKYIWVKKRLIIDNKYWKSIERK